MTLKTVFPPKDLRGQLRAWMKDNCLSPYRYVKSAAARVRMTDELSFKLVERAGKSLYTQELIKDEIKGCGRHGEMQEHKKTKKQRAVGFYCNHRRYHLFCAERYRAGQGHEMRNQYLEIIKANNLWGLWHNTFTLPEEVRTWIDRNPKEGKNFLKDHRRATALTIKETLGLTTKTRNKQPGFKILYHPVSSGNPYKQSSHFHAMILPMVADLKSGEIEKFDKFQDHAKIKRLYKKNLDKVLIKYGLSDYIKDGYTVHLSYLDKSYESSINHTFRYNNRSQVGDVIRTIKKAKDSLEDFIVLLHDKKENVFEPMVKTADQVLDTLEYILDPGIQVAMSYGFMRTIEKYSDLLGIKRDDFEDDENWISLYSIIIHREYRHVYDKKREKIVLQVETFYRKRDGPEKWHKVDPGDLRGELASLSNRKLFKAVR